jgi:D-lactate dehydrogenase (cytochrome)
MTVTAQAGVTRLQLEAATGPHGLWFPVDPGADATLGGMAATNASGTTAVRYGGMRAHTLEMQAVLPGGHIIRAGSRAAKSSSGYHVAGLLVGSEGTLAVITELTLRIHPIPEHVVVARASFPTVEAACAAAWTMLATGLHVSRCEFLDAWTVEAVNAFSRSRLPAAPLLFVEIAGEKGATQGEIEAARECAFDERALTFETVEDPSERSQLWRARHEALMACLARVPGSSAMTTDVAVPTSELPAAIERAREVLDGSAVQGGILGHIGDGNFHVVLLVDPERPETVREAQRLNSLIVEDALARSGTCTGEHGIGSGKVAYLMLEHPDLFPLYRGIKAAFDPNGIMNPGKIF